MNPVILAISVVRTAERKNLPHESFTTLVQFFRHSGVSQIPALLNAGKGYVFSNFVESVCPQ